MGFAILRAKKIKTAGGVNLSLKHAYRDQITPNADPSRLSQNVMLIPTREEALARFNERLSQVEGKIRKNGVLCVEYLITASPEDMNRKTKTEQDQYFREALRWLEERHGKENIITAGIHRDESTPHLYVHVVPMDRNRNKLNCRAFLGGAEMLSAMQTDFYEKVAKNHGLERGIKGSKARHTRVRDFYKNINNHQQIAEFNHSREIGWKQAKIDIEPRILGYEEKFLGLKKEPIYESKAHIEERIYKDNFKPVADRNYNLQLQNKSLEARLATFVATHRVDTSELNKTQINAIQSQIEHISEQNRLEKEQERLKEQEKRSQKRSIKRSTGGMKI